MKGEVFKDALSTIPCVGSLSRSGGYVRGTNSSRMYHVLKHTWASCPPSVADYDAIFTPLRYAEALA